MHTGTCETYRRRLRLWGVATLVETAVLAIGLLVTESLDVGLYDLAFAGVLYFSLFVLVPLMVTTPVSMLVTAVYALKYRRRCPQGSSRELRDPASTPGPSDQLPSDGG